MATSSEKLPQLVETTGPFRGRAHPMPFGEHVVGRGGDATIRLEHKDVSRRHARLEVGPLGVRVHDLGSKNGVFCHGKRITAPVLLVHDQTLTIGDLELRLSHPASQVSRALAAAGEATVTITSLTDAEQRKPRPRLLVPLLAVLVFGVLVAVMLAR